MIYCVDKKMFPSRQRYAECHSYKDENGLEWKIARVQNGFFVGYFGDAYFKEDIFCIEIEEKYIRINNTGFFFIQNTEFECFYEFRNVLKSGYTDDIWEAIEEFLKERLIYDKGITKTESI